MLNASPMFAVAVASFILQCCVQSSALPACTLAVPFSYTDSQGVPVDRCLSRAAYCFCLLALLVYTRTEAIYFPGAYRSVLMTARTEVVFENHVKIIRA